MIENKAGWVDDQIMRLSQLKGYPRVAKDADQDAKRAAAIAFNELVVALRCATSEAQARAIISRWLEPPPKDCPTPAELRQAIYADEEAASKASEKSYQVTPTRCDKCGDTGFRHEVRKIHGEPYDYAAVCGCRSEGGRT